MKYQIKTISSREEIESCVRADIDRYVWEDRNDYIPTAYAYMGFIPGEGLFYKMICEESNPLTRVSEYHGMVCNDSCMECFLAFPAEGEQLSPDVLYANLETNSLGNMYAKFSKKGVNGREFISDEMYKLCNPTAKVEGGKWSIEVLIPLALLEQFEEVPKMEKGAKFYCNFYKISQTEGYEHYGSYTTIDLEKPNFHCPQFFAEAEIV